MEKKNKITLYHLLLTRAIPTIRILKYKFIIKQWKWLNFQISYYKFWRHCFHPQHMCTKKSYFLVSSTMFHHDHGATFSNPPYPSFPSFNYYCQIPTPRGALTTVKCLRCSGWEGKLCWCNLYSSTVKYQRFMVVSPDVLFARTQSLEPEVISRGVWSRFAQTESRFAWYKLCPIFQ